MHDSSVTIVGGGFSGVLFALQLLRVEDGPKVTLIERTGAFGLGAAYATVNPEHLLNTRAGNMSAFPETSDHFLRWLLDRSDDPTIGRMSFVQRKTYGAYIQHLLDDALARPPIARRLTLVNGRAVRLEKRDEGFAVGLDDGGEVLGDAAVLALGNLQPAEPATIDPQVFSSSRYVAEAWRVDLAQKVGRDEAVFFVGAGLTMIDVAVALDAAGHRGPLIALSRRGLLPRAHIEAPPSKIAPPGLPRSLSQSLRVLRRMSRGGLDWRTVFDGLRPVTRQIWEAMSPTEQKRFLRHARPWWDVHRHRLAPNIAERIDALRASGRLQVVAGRLLDIRRRARGFEAHWRRRGESAVEATPADWIVNCIGPHSDIRQTGEPILDALLRNGLIRPDPLRLGLEVDGESRVVDCHGATSPRLVAVGPLTRGAFWESTAVPDIRTQVAGAADRMLDYLRSTAKPDPAVFQRINI